MSQNALHPLVTRRTFVRGLGLMSATAALAACGQTTGTDQTTKAPAPLLAIIHTNDTHGHDVAVEATDDQPGNFSMAAVAEFRQTVLSVCTNSLISCSSFLVLGPVVIQPERIASLTSFASASVISGGEKGMFFNFMFIL